MGVAGAMPGGVQAKRRGDGFIDACCIDKAAGQRDRAGAGVLGDFLVAVGGRPAEGRASNGRWSHR